MVSFLSMGRRSIGLLLLLLSIGCRPASEQDRAREEWLQVLALKKALNETAPAQAASARQSWVDALTEFVRAHPDHPRATEVYDEIELEFARQLVARGHDLEAIPHYESYLARNPDDRTVRTELHRVLGRRRVARNQMLELQRGMTMEEVSNRIGSPPPGWVRTSRKGERELISWYYPREEQEGIAAVHFSGDRVLEVDCD